MPSPIGHALGGLAAGYAVAPRVRWPFLALFAIAGMLPDLDFLLPIQHRGPSHSITAAALAFVVSFAVLHVRGAQRASLRLAAAVAAAYLSHTLLDWLGEDSSSPRGLMALWPFSQTYYISGIDLFSAVNRRYWIPGFWRGNAIAAVREVAILGPAVWLIRQARRTAGRTDPAVVRPRRTDRIPDRSYDPGGRRRPSA